MGKLNGCCPMAAQKASMQGSNAFPDSGPPSPYSILVFFRALSNT